MSSWMTDRLSLQRGFNHDKRRVLVQPEKQPSRQVSFNVPFPPRSYLRAMFLGLLEALLLI